MDLLYQLITDYTLRNVALGSAVLGMVSGALGSYAVLRQQSLLGDAVAHAALPGIALAFLLTGSKVPLVLILGAALAGWLATILVSTITERTRIKYDSALGVLLSVFFGFGLMLLTFIQKLPNASQAGLETFLFGQAAALVARDVYTMAGIGLVVLIVVALFWKEFQLLSFDVEFGNTLGLPMRHLDLLMTTLLVIAIVIGLQTVGVVLMSAMLIAPAAAARQWTDRLGRMVVLAMMFGAFAGISGAVLSSVRTQLPTGPTIVLCISVIVLFSMLLAPNRGLVWRKIRDWRNGRRLRLEATVLDLYALATQHTRPDYPHAEAVLNVMRDLSGTTAHNLNILRDQGLVQHVASDQWALTPTGVAYAQRLMQEREGIR